MKTIVVWVLVFYMTRNANDGGPAVVDNIASQQACVALGQLIRSRANPETTGFTCVAVRKAVP